jgi:hypothetical protein
MGYHDVKTWREGARSLLSYYRIVDRGHLNIIGRNDGRFSSSLQDRLAEVRRDLRVKALVPFSGINSPFPPTHRRILPENHFLSLHNAVFV